MTPKKRRGSSRRKNIAPKPNYQVGQKIQARWLGGEEWYDGKIIKQGKRKQHVVYDVVYDDDSSVEKNVYENLVALRADVVVLEEEGSNSSSNSSSSSSNSNNKKKVHTSTTKHPSFGSDVLMIASTLVPLLLAVLAMLCLPTILGEERGGQILDRALSKAFRGGLPGFFAATIQILSLMWLRTVVNYQYKTGAPFMVALRTLWKEGGPRRFYRGFLPAVALVPLSRFGDTASNAGVLALLDGSVLFPVVLQTAVASGASSLWRVLLMPLSVLKTTLQVGGKQGIPDLRKKVQSYGAMAVFFRGTGAMMLAQFMGHYPWFAVSNALKESIPADAFGNGVAAGLWRAAFIGIVASVASDFITNAIHVVRTHRQTSNENLSYTQTIKRVVDEGGIKSLLFRGLGAKMLVNCLNSIVFSVLLKLW